MSVATLSPLVQARRRVFGRVLPPVLFAAFPLIRTYMRHAPENRIKGWLWEHVLYPYTIDHEQRLRLIQTDFGSYMVGMTRDHVFHHLWMFGVWEPNLTRWIGGRLRAGDAFVDVGANLGYFTMLGAQRVGPTGKVVAIEALPPAVALLQRNLSLNPSGNVRVVDVAAYDSETVLPMFYRSEDDVCGASLAWKWVGELDATVKTAPLSAILEHDELARTRLVKIDVEGAESHVVRGLLPVIDQMPGDAELVIELTATTYPEVKALLSPLGFRPYYLQNPFDAVSARSQSEVRPTRIADDAPLPQTAEGVTYVVFSRHDAAEL